MNVNGQARTVAAANADNAAAAATLAAPGVGFKWQVKGWGASFSPGGPAATVTATVTIGATTITFAVGATSPWNVDLVNDSIDGTDNTQPSISLAASGTAGQLGRVWISAVKVPIGFS